MIGLILTIGASWLAASIAVTIAWIVTIGRVRRRNRGHRMPSVDMPAGQPWPPRRQP